MIRRQNKNKGYRRGQFSLEFMSTYGWALLIMMSVVAALVFITPNMKSLTSKRCVFGPGLACMGTTFSSDNLTVVLRNNMAQTIYNISAETNIPSTIDCDVSSVTLRADQNLMISCDNEVAGGLNIADDSKIGLNVYYQKTKSGYVQILTGEVYAKYK